LARSRAIWEAEAVAIVNRKWHSCFVTQPDKNRLQTIKIPAGWEKSYSPELENMPPIIQDVIY